VEAEIKLLCAKGQEIQLLVFDNADMGEGAWSRLRAGINAAWNADSAAKVKKEIAAFAPDVVHVHNFFFMASPAVITEAYRLRVPVIVTLHNYRLICVNSLLMRDNKVCELCVHHTIPWWGIRYGCYHHSAMESAMVGYMSAIHKITGTWRNKVDMFITPAEFGRQKLINSSLKIDPANITVKRNFVADPGIGSPGNRSSFYLFVGRLSKEKGIHLLAKCFSLLPGEELIIAGDGPESEELVRLYGHLPNIKFLGKQGKVEIFSLMKSCRALVFPSIWYEGSPVAIIEAFATSTPVIASCVGAMTEMIVHDHNGFLFDTGDENRLKEAVAEMNRRCVRQDYSLYQGARDSYLAHYYPDQCYASVMTIYEEAIKRKKHP
jgi:glycosyltransferase involved in cell wall biosynthesis